jgi:peptide/nickel transport system substrate-binding protein
MESSNKKRRFSFSNSYFAFILRRKTSDRLIFNVAVLCVLASVLFAILTINDHFTTSVPTQGGTIVEGIVGTPRFVNPVLAINRADHDMVALIYSGLMKLDEQGNLVPDIAESIAISEDGKTYTIKIRNGVRFHNGAELTAKDVLFTISLIQNPELKSPLRANWDGVVVEELNERELQIVLEEAYTPFLENLTVGILPRELWNELPIEQIPFSQNNTQPIGSGPYTITDVLRTKSGLIEAYKLEAYRASNQNPNITTLVFNFYQNEEELLTALEKKEIASTPSISAENFSRINTDTYQIIESPLPRTFAIYFNQNKSPALRDESVREALDIILNKEVLVESVLSGYGIPTHTPVPPGFLPVESTNFEESQTTEDQRKIKAEGILREGGWTKTTQGTWEKEIDKNMVTLGVSLSTANTALFDKTATYVADTWKALGVDVNVSQFEQNDLVQAVIRPRDFEALLYGADIGRQADLYPFWHSSQKNDPGLNIAQYANIDVDAILQRLRMEKEETTRIADIRKVEEIIMQEKPAVFLFVPTFAYVLDTAVTATPLTKLSRQSERFANVARWHIKSNNVWPIFSNTTNN